MLIGPSIGQLYPLLLQTLLNEGSSLASPRGQQTSERLGIQLQVTDLTQNILVHPVRDLNYRFMVGEWLWIMAGRDDVESLARYNQEMRRFSDDGEVLEGAYGPRLRKTEHKDLVNGTYDQLQWCVQKLREDPDSRQAVASIWTPCPGPSLDVPCTLSLQFLQREGKLHAVATMRSSDAWLGFPYDFFTFSMIANCLAGELGAQPGSLTMQLGSSHLYEQHWAKATELIARWEGSSTVQSPALPNLPSCQEFAVMLNPGFGRPPIWNQYPIALAQKTKAEALEVLINATRP